MPTFESVVNEVIALLKDTVLAVTLPLRTASSKSNCRISSATAPESITSLVARLYVSIVIFLSLTSVRTRSGVIYTEPGKSTSISTLLALKTMVFSA